MITGHVRGDHPRSRGVYSRRPGDEPPARGSSPLARGLRPSRPGRVVPQWIIPARAGFTPPPGARRPAARDHPRSRGVYRLEAEAGQASGGSSPLARGLPRTLGATWWRAGIIPARAGFTTTLDAFERAERDHPRSRGVYGPCSTPGSRAAGSSPLARGLHFLDTYDVEPIRIIPARAGFTPPLRAATGTLRDHPRSRGVYSGTRPTTGGPTGSSPLARGLHDGRDRVMNDLRIIPARAGFTWRRRP